MSSRIERLRELLEEPLLVTNLVNVLYLTGFDSSNAALLVEPDHARLFTDFRYIESARAIEEVEAVQTKRSLIGWLSQNLSGRIGFEADVLPWSYAEQLREAHAYAVESRREIAALQNQYSLLERGAETEVLPLCLEYRIGFIPYFPLASGLLTGKYRRGQPAPSGSRLENRPDARADERLEQVEALEEFATARGHTLLELAIGSLASRPGVVSVIAGAMTPDQVRANAAAAWRLAGHDLDELDAIRRAAA